MSLAQGQYADDGRRYLLTSRIATGGMGEVWRADDTSLGRTVAVKLLKPEYADDPAFRARFQTEARHAAALHHPNIASVYDFGESSRTDGSGLPRPYLVMELVDGQPLSALLHPDRPLDPDAVRDLLAQASDGVAAAHAAGIVHRDLKPANLLVTADRRIKITDFGIARAMDGLGLTQTGQVMGTPQYLSPEQARGNTATPASDVYALGVVTFECLAGRPPFRAESPVATALSHLNDPVPPLPTSVPADLAAVVTRALSKDPAARYADAAEYAAALRSPGPAAIAATQVINAPVPSPPTAATQVLPGAAALDPTGPLEAVTVVPEDEEEKRTPWGVIALILLVAALIVVVALLIRNGSEDDETPPPTPSTSASDPTEDTTPSEEPTTSEPASPSEPTSEAPEPINVDPDRYIGRDIREVEADLRGLDLQVRRNEVPNPGGEPAGVVTDVNPSGDLSPGEQVTVSFWGPEPEPEPEPEPSPTQTTPTQAPSTTPPAEPEDTPAEEGTTE